MDNDDQVQSSGDGQTLGDSGQRESLPESWVHPQSQSRFGRIGAWSAGSPPGSGDDNEDDEPQSFFAGGERSGISVEGPSRRGGQDLVRDILRKAAEGGQSPAGATGSGSRLSNAFFGGGHTLGSDDVPSAFINDLAGENEDSEEPAVRNIIFWRNGFSIENGPLLRYDDPQNANLLNEINTGHASISMLNVRVGQPVSLRVQRRTNEDYVVTKRSIAAFGGQGQRLGSPIPALVSTTAASSPSRATNEAISIQPKFEVDPDAPTTSIQVRLADGTRLVARMNLTHTVGDIRNFINASRSGQSSHSYTIGTIFPNRILDDNTQTVEAAGLKNSVIVQRMC